jgi:very-short-patch-repair endonuclease
MHTTRTPISPLARKLRKEAFWAERSLWEVLRNERLEGRHFERQYIFRNADERSAAVFVADFYCPEEGLVLSLDGDIQRPYQAVDMIRDEILYKNGLRLLRIRHDEVHDIEKLQHKIRGLFRTPITKH